MKHPPHGSLPRCQHCGGNRYYQCYLSDVAYIHAVRCLLCSRETIIDVTDGDGMTLRAPRAEIESNNRVRGAA